MTDDTNTNQCGRRICSSANSGILKLSFLELVIPQEKSLTDAEERENYPLSEWKFPTFRK